MLRSQNISLVLILSLLAGTISTSVVHAQFAVYDAAVFGSTNGTTAAVASAAAQELIAKTVQTTTVSLFLNNPADFAVLGGVTGASTAACQGISQAEQIANTVDSFGDFSVIGGSPVQATKLAAKIKALQTVKICREAQLSAVDALVPASVAGAEAFAKKQSELSVEINSLSTRIESLKQQQNAEVKDVLKAVMVRIVLNLSKNLTTEVVNNLVEKYKISDYLAYGDALTTQVYSMKYINENFQGDARQQMMIRSLLQSEKFPEKVKTVQAFANSKAQEYLGTACNVATPGINPNDESYFLKCLAAYGAPQANAQYHYLQAFDQAQAATAAGRASAQAEVSQSDGFAPPRNCDGSVALQQQLDTQYDTTYAEKEIAVAAAAKLKAALNASPPKTTQEEYNKAQAAADQAIANANALGQRPDSPIIDICKAIDSPASFVSSSIAKFLEKHLVQDTDLKTDNLPFYASFLADVTSNFLTNILTGGKSTSQVLKEAGVGALNGAIIGISQQAQQGQTPTSPFPTSPTGSVSINARSSGGALTTALVAGQSYTLVINFSSLVGANADPNFKPVRLVVSGLAGGTYQDNLSVAEQQAGVVELPGLENITQSFTLTVQFYGPNTQTSPSGTPLGTNGGWQQRFTVSGVAGASIVLPRGPALSAVSFR